MQIYFTPTRMAKIKKKKKVYIGKDVEKLKPSSIAGGNVKWYKPLWKTVWQFLNKLKIELPHDPAITLLGTYMKELKTGIQTNTCT